MYIYIYTYLTNTKYINITVIKVSRRKHQAFNKMMETIIRDEDLERKRQRGQEVRG